MSRANKYFKLPLSGQIMGLVFNALQIQYPKNIRKDVQRYFRGVRIHEETRDEIFWLLANKIVEDGILPHLPIFDEVFILNEDKKPGLQIQIVRELENYSKHWDETCAKIRGWRIPKSRKEEIFLAALRLLIIDLAVRGGVIYYFTKKNPFEETLPLWACDNAGKNYFKSLKLRCATGKPSIEELAFSANVSEKTVCSWIYCNQRPSRDHLKSLAQEFCKYIPEISATELFNEMVRFYFLTSLCNRLTKHLGRETAKSFVSALSRFIARFLDYLIQEDNKSSRILYSHNLMFLFRGVWSVYDQQIQCLWENEGDPDWREAPVSAKEDWFLRIMEVSLKSDETSVLHRTEASLYPYLNPACPSLVSSHQFRHKLEDI
jgi:hypothetical protein